ncbi:MAG: hypothetical protein JW959_10010 [Pirellulales bacterium]|nr:hypothetical protein [Pirellulales bacterium]
MNKLPILLAVSAMIVAIGGATQAATVYVNPGDSIQAAVNGAISGDIINVSAGTYSEQVTLTAGKNLTFVGAGRDLVTWIAPAGGQCITGSMSGYTESMYYDISGFTFNTRSAADSTWGAGIEINRASSGPLSLTIHDNRFIEDRASGDGDHWGTSMLLCHNRYAVRDGSGNAAVSIYNNIDETWGGMTISNSQAYDIYDNVFDGCSDAIYNGHGCPDVAGQTFGDHHIYENTFKNAIDDLHPSNGTPAIWWQYYGAGEGTHLASLIEKNCFYNNDTAIEFVFDTDMTYPDHVLTDNNFIANDMAVSVVGDFASTVNAQGNWWGAADGPGPVGPGSGNPITTYVDYGGFATAPIDGVAIPEPGTIAMLIFAGLTALAAAWFRAKKK